MYAIIGHIILTYFTLYSFVYAVNLIYLTPVFPHFGIDFFLFQLLEDVTDRHRNKALFYNIDCYHYSISINTSTTLSFVA